MLARIAILVFLSAASVSGQAPAFETVSVKPSPATGSPAAGGGPNDPVTFSAHRITLKVLIASAYEVPDFQVSGGAAWTASDMFDIDAKAGKPSNQGEKMLMLRALLADRFQLAIHREQATLAAYALVVAKEGPKFHAAQAGDRPPAMVPGTLPVRSMKQLASILTMYFRFHMSFPSAGEPPLSDPEPLPVIDQTGLTGEYDTFLDLRQSRDWFVVLQQQLGLKLEARKVPVEILAIDRAVKPGSN